MDCVTHVGRGQVKLPKILINGAISVLRKSVQKKGNFDIR